MTIARRGFLRFYRRPAALLGSNGGESGIAQQVPATASALKTAEASPTAPKPKRILIAGLGNILLGDDGVGVHAVRRLGKSPLAGVLAVEVGTAVLDALHLFAWADKILAIDAMRAGGPSGTIYAFAPEDIVQPSPSASLHELSLTAALRLLPPENQPEIKVLGVEPGTIDYGLDLSPSVQAALPRLITITREIAAAWSLRS